MHPVRRLGVDVVVVIGLQRAKHDNDSTFQGFFVLRLQSPPPAVGIHIEARLGLDLRLVIANHESIQ